MALAATHMKITPQHRLEGAIWRPLPGEGASMPTRRLLVIHFTAGASALSSIDYWRSKGGAIGAHLVIDRDGTIYQCRAFNRTCGHAGVSRWVDPGTGRKFTSLNSCAIGIELANAGDDRSALSWARKQPTFRGVVTKHRNGGAAREWEDFPLAQQTACFDAALALVQRYRLDDVTGHDCIAPERKADPGPLFPMADLRRYCGFAGLPTVHWPR